MEGWPSWERDEILAFQELFETSRAFTVGGGKENATFRAESATSAIGFLERYGPVASADEPGHGRGGVPDEKEKGGAMPIPGPARARALQDRKQG